jgi:hypothetical protein
MAFGLAREMTAKVGQFASARFWRQGRIEATPRRTQGALEASERKTFEE